MLPLDESQFLADFTPITGAKPTSATSSKAGVFELATNFRFRIPSPLVMPTINFGLGFMELGAHEINYTSAERLWLSETQQHRSGAGLTIGAGGISSVTSSTGMGFSLKPRMPTASRASARRDARRTVWHEQRRYSQEHRASRRCAAV